MLWASIKNNLKTILRDPTTALAALVAIIMQFMYGLNIYNYVNQIDVHPATRTYDYVMNVMMDIFAKPVFQIAFPFLGVIIAVHLFQEMRTGVYDILSAGQMSFRRFFLAKITSYYLLGLGMSVLLGLVFEILFLLVYRPFSWEVDWLLVLGAQLAWMLALYTSCLLIPIALGIFAASLSGFGAMAPIVNCAYYYLPSMLPAKWYALTSLYDYVHVAPFKLRIFMKYWPLELDEWYSVTYGMMFEVKGEAPIDCTSSFGDAILSYFSMLLIAVALFTASYFLLKRRYERA